MATTQDLSVHFSKQLLKRNIIPDNNILNCEVVRNADCKDVTFKITTEDEKYTFTVNLLRNGDQYLNGLKNSEEYLTVLEKHEEFYPAIRNISINEYDPCEFDIASVCNLKSILGYRALKHATNIKTLRMVTHQAQVKKLNNLSGDYREVMCTAVETLNIPNIDQNTLGNGIENLLKWQQFVENQNLIFVPTYLLQNRQIFRSKDGNGNLKIVNTGDLIYLPLVYDILLTIFHLSNQKFRQCHYHELVDYYYSSLQKNLQNLSLDISTVLSLDEYEKQIKYFLPFVKLEMAYSFCQKCVDCNERCPYNNLATSSIFELYEYILYPNLRREDCYQIIRNKIGSTNYKMVSWSMSQLEERPGFLGDYFKLKIKINLNGDVETLNLFTKCLPTTSEIVKDLAGTSFEKERFFYSTFISELKSLGLEEILDFFPKCYFTRHDDVLVFEDISLKNYKCLNKTEPMSYETMRLVIKKLAKLHACSIIYEERLSKKCGKEIRIYDRYEKYLQEVNLLVDENNENSKITICGIQTLMKYILDAFPDIPKRMTMEAFKDKVKQAFDSLFVKVKKTDKFRNVVCQGDFWASNIMFKNKEDETPVDCRIIDYQLIRYCPPTHDLFFLIYVNSDKEMRSKYMSRLVDDYYSELSKITERFGVDINEVYTYQEFLECCEYMKPAAICIAALYLPMTLCPGHIIQDLLSDKERATIAFSIDRKEIIQDLYNEGSYRRRNREIVEDLYEICESNSFHL